ncbi:unnamed protein product (macronuclear) [Paramecium tetraurelia]|uniref:PX domain-containing protein n=1 Tax=Paramecium tetraurelia TaxID=5888 RepID=A0BP47_PARTE|nr:uncharacterized protein GSPATT00005063001 [Paramecium tetraurelia]CAK60314.1 unnamed protein product [Paramecium tetraurelia]|eukprot:XP_001427712.1 hypothetical protein (macronuclear) [Paramecium tetraurelia strain d4-2]
MDQQTEETLNLGIEVQVCDPIVKKDGLKNYVVYTLKGQDKEGQFCVVRRFNEFDCYRITLQIRWPGCYVPPLPIKKPVGNMDQKFIDERMHYLNLFMGKISTINHLWYSEETKVFIKAGGDIEKQLVALQKPSAGDIIYKYETIFNDFSGKEINDQLLSKIGNFSLFLKRIQPQLETFQQQAKQLVQSRLQCQDNMNLLLDYLMPEYEKNCLTEYVVNPENKLVFVQHNTDLYQQYRAANEKSALDNFALSIKIETRDIDAVLDAILCKDKYEQIKQNYMTKLCSLNNEKKDIENGKTTLKSLFNSNKEEFIQKTQQQIDNIQKEIEQLTILCDMITIILGYIILPRYKQEKEKNYYQLLKQMAQYQVQKAQAERNYWLDLDKNQMFTEV